MDSNDLHVWRLDLSDPRWDGFAHVLSPQESQRHARVVVQEARTAWRRSRIALRLLLSEYVGVAPRDIVFGEGERGKPMLEAAGFDFNVSHSKLGGLVALAREAVGIDLECLLGHQGDYVGLLKTICSADEFERVSQCPAGKLQAVFFRLWTRKEAYCKATGQGLYKDVRSFRIGPAVSGASAGVIDPAAGAAAPCHLHDLDCDPGWMASVCTVLAQPSVTQRSFAPPC
jgi:4'-phosphopantetheinyl transferase